MRFLVSPNRLSMRLSIYHYWLSLSLMVWSGSVVGQDAIQGDFSRSRENASEIFSNSNLNRRDCRTSSDCAAGETCQKVCFWLHPEDQWIGCKIKCIQTASSPLSEVGNRKDTNVITEEATKIKQQKSNRFSLNLSASLQSAELVNNTQERQSPSVAKSSDGFEELESFSADSNDTSQQHLLNSCAPLAVCSLMCTIIFDENGCQQCVCPVQTQPPKVSSGVSSCKLNRDCVQPSQFCSRSQKRCQCRPDYATLDSDPLDCRPRSAENSPANFITTQSYASNIQSPIDHNVVTVPSGIPMPKDFLKEIKQYTETSREFLLASTQPSTFNRKEEIERVSSFETDRGSSSSSITTSFEKHYRDPSALWDILLTVSGTTSPPAVIEPNPNEKGDVASRCSSGTDCKPNLLCCSKTYCDGFNACGVAKFCLRKCTVE